MCQLITHGTLVLIVDRKHKLHASQVDNMHNLIYNNINNVIPMTTDKEKLF